MTAALLGSANAFSPGKFTGEFIRAINTPGASGESLARPFPPLFCVGKITLGGFGTCLACCSGTGCRARSGSILGERSDDILNCSIFTPPMPFETNISSLSVSVSFLKLATNPDGDTDIVPGEGDVPFTFFLFLANSCAIFGILLPSFLILFTLSLDSSLLATLFFCPTLLTPCSSSVIPLPPTTPKTCQLNRFKRSL
ncbi:hypothetical protein HG537_0G03720 [Torulaspora globosa]|uniref:Uncharacterized protein n=1 Tax=Torulaspora globosa TaxID=48254 RepID=A0A7H9HZ02_9SACH|nr:hypothetical protein HG537_0G03720 [Torulaspora sp. CBS 2947]